MRIGLQKSIKPKFMSFGHILGFILSWTSYFYSSLHLPMLFTICSMNLLTGSTQLIFLMQFVSCDIMFERHLVTRYVCYFFENILYSLSLEVSFKKGSLLLHYTQDTVNLIRLLNLQERRYSFLKMGHSRPLSLCRESLTQSSPQRQQYTHRERMFGCFHFC